jgi:hypothetical protein
MSVLERCLRWDFGCVWVLVQSHIITSHASERVSNCIRSGTGNFQGHSHSHHPLTSAYVTLLKSSMAAWSDDEAAVEVSTYTLRE